jgi:hypothetical protein
MPAFEIDSPVDGFAYPSPMTMPPPPPIPINGNHDGDPYNATRMWILQGNGFAPTTPQNPFEAGAAPLTTVGVASWSYGHVMTPTAGTKHIRVWILKPGSLEIQYAKADFSIKATPPPPPPPRPPAHGNAKKKRSKKPKKKSS